jgi:hypothetical protein
MLGYFLPPQKCVQAFPIGALLIVSMAPFTQLTHDQLNNCWEFLTVVEHLRRGQMYDLVELGQVLNIDTRVIQLTQGKLLKQPDWNEWQASEFLQLDQYDSQGIVGAPVAVSLEAAVFHLVWTYAINASDGRKKAQWVCDGSPHSG